MMTNTNVFDEVRAPHPESYLVKTKSRMGMKSQIWHSKNALLLPVEFPFQLMMKNGNIVLHSKSEQAPAYQVQNGADGSIVFVFDEHRKIEITKATLAPAAYADRSGVLDNPRVSNLSRLIAVAGVGRVLTSLDQVASAYIASSGEDAVFTLSQHHEGYQLKVLKKHIRVRVGGKDKLLEPGQELELSHLELKATRITLDLSWWKFNVVQPPLEMLEDFDTVVDESSNSFKRILFSLFGLCALLGAAVYFVPQSVLDSLKDVEQPAEVAKKEDEVKVVKVIKLPSHVFKVKVTDQTPMPDQANKGGGSGAAAGSMDAGSPLPRAGELGSAKAGNPQQHPENQAALLKGKPNEAPKPVANSAPSGSKAAKAGIGIPKVNGFAAKNGAKPALALSPEAKSAQILARNANAFKDALGGIVASMKAGGAVSGSGAADGKQNDKGASVFEGGTQKIAPTKLDAGDVLSPNGTGNGGSGGSGAGRGILTGYGNGTGSKAGLIGNGGAFVGTSSGWGTGNGTGNGDGDGEGSVSAGLSKQEVGEVIHAHMNEVKFCYESALLSNPTLEGKLMTIFTISNTGQVKQAKAGTPSVSNPKLEQCILKRLAVWPFPKPRGNVEVDVSYPFYFKTLGKK